jgi:predicted RNase H-like nuclease (RuvC/YqgF family)
LTINQDFSLVAVKARAKAAKGAELTAKETAKIEELTAQLAEKATQVEALEKELNKIKAEQMLKRLKGAQKYAAMTAEQKAADRQAKMEKVQMLLKAGCY